MPAIEDSVRVKTSPAGAFQALSRAEGVRGWWSKKCEISDHIGGECALQFDKQGTIVKMRFRIDAVDQRRVAWTCIGHDMPSWIGTTVEWTMTPNADHVVIQLVHAGWKDQAPDAVAQGWKHFLSSLKSYVETGTGQPW